jgi:hypothetical protein
MNDSTVISVVDVVERYPDKVVEVTDSKDQSVIHLDTCKLVFDKRDSRLNFRKKLKKEKK